MNITDQVIGYLKENIESGEWKVGEKIPSENPDGLGAGSESLQHSYRITISDRNWSSEELSGKGKPS